MSKLRKRTEWSGQHRGVSYLISHHGIHEKYQPDGIWCYYLIISEKQIPKEHIDKFDLEAKADKKGRVYYPYSEAWIASLPWHCGITYYNKLGGLDGSDKYFKIGCDYSHYWDEGHTYSESYLKYDAKNTIDALLEDVPLLVRCSWDGCYQKESKTTPWGTGQIANGCIEARNAAYPKSDPIVRANQ